MYSTFSFFLLFWMDILMDRLMNKRMDGEMDQFIHQCIGWLMDAPLSSYQLGGRGYKQRELIGGALSPSAQWFADTDGSFPSTRSGVERGGAGYLWDGTIVWLRPPVFWAPPPTAPFGWGPVSLRWRDAGCSTDYESNRRSLFSLLCLLSSWVLHSLKQNIRRWVLVEEFQSLKSREICWMGNTRGLNFLWILSSQGSSKGRAIFWDWMFDVFFLFDPEITSFLLLLTEVTSGWEINHIKSVWIDKYSWGYTVSATEIQIHF